MGKVHEQAILLFKKVKITNYLYVISYTDELSGSNTCLNIKMYFKNSDFYN